MIDGYINWLQNTLGDKYVVVSEEKNDFVPGKNVAILSEISGSNFKSSIAFTYQLSVLTNDVVNTMKELQEYTWIHNDEILTTPEFPYIKNVMSQPVNVSNFIQMNEEYAGTINITISLITALDLLDIESVTIDDELMNSTQTNISYATVTDTNRVNGEQLNETNINESSLQVQVIQPLRYGNLSTKILNIFFGAEDKNTDFHIVIKFTNGLEYDLNFKLSAGSQNNARAMLTTNSITFIH